MADEQIPDFTITFPDIVEAICKRPKLYVPTGTFFEVVSYLEGAGGCSHIMPSYSGHSAFTPFKIWMAEKTGKVPDSTYGNYFPLSWHEFRELYSSDDEAIANLAKLYLEFDLTQTIV